MKDKLKKIANCTTVFAKSIYKVIETLSRGERATFAEEPEREVIILGNGPSLNDIDLYAVKESGMDVACVNFFPTKNEIFWELKPKYFVLFDPGFYTQGAPELFECLKKVDWPMQLIGMQDGKLPVDNPNITFVPVNTSILFCKYMNRYMDFLYKKNLLNVGQQNVVIGAGFYFVCKRVKHLYYAGIDMSEFKQLFVDEKCEIYTDYIHNYGMERNYVTGVKKGGFCDLLLMYQHMFEQFYYLARFAERQGVKVTNLSMNSYVDVFEKKPLFRKK